MSLTSQHLALLFCCLSCLLFTGTSCLVPILVYVLPKRARDHLSLSLLVLAPSPVPGIQKALAKCWLNNKWPTRRCPERKAQRYPSCLLWLGHICFLAAVTPGLVCKRHPENLCGRGERGLAGSKSFSGPLSSGPTILPPHATLAPVPAWQGWC